MNGWNRITARIVLVFAACLVVAAVGVPGESAGSLPVLPPAIKVQGKLRVGEKCDYPPSGYLDSSGKNVGIEVEMAHQIAAWAFGSRDKVEIVCVTAANRIQYLTGRKVDLLIATLGVTPERAKVIDFTEPYQWGGGQVMVPKTSALKSLRDAAGKTLIVLKGTTQEAWLEEKMPSVKLLKLDKVSDALQALEQGRADGYAHDTAVLLGIVAEKPNYRLLPEVFAVTYAAAGVRKGELGWRNYVSAAILRMKEEHLFAKWVDAYVSAKDKDYWTKSFESKPAEAK